MYMPPRGRISSKAATPASAARSVSRVPTDNIGWHRKWNCVDAIHDAAELKKSKNKQSGSVVSKPLFISTLKALFRYNSTTDKDTYGVITDTKYYDTIQPNPKPLTELNDINGGGGLHDNLRPQKFGLSSAQTVSQYFDPAPKVYRRTDSIQGLDENGQVTIGLGQYGFKSGWTFKAHLTGAHITFTISAPLGNMYTTTVSREGYVTECNHGDDLESNWISGNLEKNYFITINDNQRSNPGVMWKSIGYVANKVLCDLSHTWFCENNQAICTTDTYLAKRCMKMGIKCIHKHYDRYGFHYRYYHTQMGSPVIGGGQSGGIKSEEEDEEGEDGHIRFINATIHKFVLHRINNGQIIHEKLNGGSGRDSLKGSIDKDYGRFYNGTVTRSHRINTVYYTDEYIIEGLDWLGYTTASVSTLALTGISALFVGPQALGIPVMIGLSLCLSNPTRMMSGGIRTPKSEDSETYKINLSSEYTKLITVLGKFLAVGKASISGKTVSCTKDVRLYITKLIVNLAKHKESAIGSLPMNEAFFKWIPSQIMFHTDLMKTEMYTPKQSYYTPMKVHKLFPYLDDATVLAAFGVENTFGGYNTFYDFFISASHPEEDIDYKIPDTVKFRELLIHLENGYSVTKKTDIPDKLPLNSENDVIQFPEQIKWFLKNGVTRENAQIFADLLYDATERECIEENDLPLEMFRALADGDILIGYTLYNLCMPFLFISKHYIVRYDFFVDLIQRIRSSRETVTYELYTQVAADIVKSEVNPIITNLEKISELTGINSEDTLLTFCSENATKIDVDELKTKTSELLAMCILDSKYTTFIDRFVKLHGKMVEVIQKNTKEQSPKRQSVKGKSPKRQSVKGKSPKRQSVKGKSPKRQSVKGKSYRNRFYTRRRQPSDAVYVYQGGTTLAA
jgi:hypothetical protein